MCAKSPVTFTAIHIGYPIITIKSKNITFPIAQLLKWVFFCDNEFIFTYMLQFHFMAVKKIDIN